MKLLKKLSILSGTQYQIDNINNFGGIEHGGSWFVVSHVWKFISNQQVFLRHNTDFCRVTPRLYIALELISPVSQAKDELGSARQTSSLVHTTLREFVNRRFILKTHQCLPSTTLTTLEELTTKKTAGHFGVAFEGRTGREITHPSQSRWIEILPIWRAFSKSSVLAWRISVDVWPNCRNEDAFSNFFFCESRTLEACSLNS